MVDGAGELEMPAVVLLAIVQDVAKGVYFVWADVRIFVRNVVMKADFCDFTEANGSKVALKVNICRHQARLLTMKDVRRPQTFQHELQAPHPNMNPKVLVDVSGLTIHCLHQLHPLCGAHARCKQSYLAEFEI
jgi:hypothetical protein